MSPIIRKPITEDWTKHAYRSKQKKKPNEGDKQVDSKLLKMLWKWTSTVQLRHLWTSCVYGCKKKQGTKLKKTSRCGNKQQTARKVVNSKTATKTLAPVAFTPNVVRASYSMPGEVKLKWLSVFGIDSEQSMELLHGTLPCRGSLLSRPPVWWWCGGCQNRHWWCLNLPWVNV